MSQQIINIGSAPNDGTGDQLRASFDKCNGNFTELYAGVTASLPIGNAIEYQFNNTTTEPPSAGQIRFNSATQSATTLLWVSHTTSSGINIKQFLSAATTGAKLVLQDKNDNTNFIKFDVTGTPIDKTTYWEVAVAVTASGGNLPNAPILAAVTAAATGGGGSGVVEYTFQSATTPPPGSGSLRFNNASATATTILYLHNISDSGIDLKQILLAMVAGDRLVVQDKGNSTNFAKFNVTGTPVDQTTYVQLPVNSTASGGTIGNNSHVLFGQSGGSGGGGGNVSNTGTPTNGQLAQWTDATHIQGVAASTITAGFAPLASPTFTGDPQAPTPATADNDTSIATTAFVKAQGYAPLASPVFTGDPQAPTPLTADNDTSIATTAFVKAAIVAAGGGGASITISDTPPASPTAGAMWWESDTGKLWLYYNDGTSSQWVVADVPSTGGINAGAVQQVYAENATLSSGTWTMAGAQTTVPQQTDGAQILTASITPKAVGNTLRVDVALPQVSVGSGTNIWAALFQDSTAAALAATSVYIPNANQQSSLMFNFELSVAATTATTFKVRVGQINTTANTIYINGHVGGNILGGSTRATLTVTEYSPVVLPAPSSSGPVLLATRTASNQANVDFISLMDGTYDEYEVHFFGVQPVANGDTLQMQIGETGTIKTASTYNSTEFTVGGGGAFAAGIYIANAAGMHLTYLSNASNNANMQAAGKVTVWRPSAAGIYKNCQWETTMYSTATYAMQTSGTGWWPGDTNAIDSLRFFFAGGNISTGTFKLYGIR